MNSITFADQVLFTIASTALELDATPEYDLDPGYLRIYSDNIDGVVDILHDNGIFNFQVSRSIDDEHDQFRTDAEADADALKSAGFGTDEDYGYYGNDE
jgi:hypothetical protein